MYFDFRFFCFKEQNNFSQRFQRTQFPSSGGVAKILEEFLTGWFSSPDRNGYPTASPSTGSEQADLRGVIVDSRISS